MCYDNGGRRDRDGDGDSDIRNFVRAMDAERDAKIDALADGHGLDPVNASLFRTAVTAGREQIALDVLTGEGVAQADAQATIDAAKQVMADYRARRPGAKYEVDANGKLRIAYSNPRSIADVSNHLRWALQLLHGKVTVALTGDWLAPDGTVKTMTGDEAVGRISRGGDGIPVSVPVNVGQPDEDTITEEFTPRADAPVDRRPTVVFAVRAF